MGNVLGGNLNIYIWVYSNHLNVQTRGGGDFLW